MANAVYPKYKEALLAGTAGYDLDNDTVNDGPYCALIDTGTYTYNAAHDFYNDLKTSPDTGTVGTDQRITGPAVTNGTLTGSDLTYTAVSGATVEGFVVYRHNTGADSTWPLVFYYDAEGGGLPVTPNGGNITITWSDTPTANNIFTLSDVDAKADIVEIGRIGHCQNVLCVCEYRYKGQHDRVVGLIAQDVARKVPDAVIEYRGFLMVNYAKALNWAAGT